MPELRALCRLAVLFRRPLHEVANWPAAEIRLILAYLTKQPSPEERMEIALAGIQAMLYGRWRREGASDKSAIDFLPYRNPWGYREISDEDERYSDIDREIFRALGNS